MLYRLAGERIRLRAINAFSSNEKTRNSEKMKNQYLYRVLAVSEGSFVYEDEDRSVILKEGASVFLPPNHPYRIFNARGDFSVINLWMSFSADNPKQTPPGITVFQDSFDPTSAEERIDFSDVPSLNRACVLFGSPSLLSLLSTLKRENESEGHDRIFEGHLLLCVLDLFRNCGKEKANLSHQDLISYINTHATENLTELDLAKRFSYHPAHINRLVKAETGLSFKQYLLGVRMSLAKQLLSETDMSKSEVAQYLGFYDLSHLNKTLKKQ